MDSDLLTGSPAPWFAALAAALLAAVVLCCAAVLLRSRARSRRALERVLAETEALRRELDELRAETRRAAHPAARQPAPAVAEYLITDVSATDAAAEDPGRAAATRPATEDGRIEGRLFADLVLRESAVRAAGVAHGVRRALAPETRHRIRFEMGREVKRARKQRRADLRAARRRLHAEQRADTGVPEEPGAGAGRQQGAA